MRPLPSKPSWCAAVLATVCAFVCLSPPSSPAQGNYNLAPGDLISIAVFQEKDLSSSYRVSGEGAINMPLIGLVRVAGEGEGEAAAKIRTKLLDGYLVNPQVTVRVVEYAKIRFTVLGQVREPKAISVAGNEEVTLLQAIGLAGGYTRLANPRKITIKRKVGGRSQIKAVDAKKMAQDGSGAAFVVKPGDIITVGERFF